MMVLVKIINISIAAVVNWELVFNFCPNMLMVRFPGGGISKLTLRNEPIMVLVKIINIFYGLIPRAINK